MVNSFSFKLCSQGSLASMALAAILASGLAAPAAAIHPNHPVGSDPERAYSSSAEGIDRVDLFSGALSLGIPIGPFTLNYSSSVWRFDEPGPGKVKAVPDKENNAGLGWHLGWGEVYSPSHWYNQTTSNQWLYVGRDGSRHFFYPTLHRSEPVVANVFYTRDNSYLRMKKLSNQAVEIEFPDGITSRFTCFRSSVPGAACSLGTTFRLHKSWDRYGSFSDPDVEVAYDQFNADENPELWNVTDRYGRSHRVYLSGGDSWINLKVTRIEVQSFNGQIAPYDFTYQTQLIERNCKDNFSAERNLSVQLLTQIDQPDGTNFRMKLPSTPLYQVGCFTDAHGNEVDDAPGVLTGLLLPTGGGIGWSWEEIEFPPGDTNSVFTTSAAVSTRLVADATFVTDPSSSILGVWTYKRTVIPRIPDDDHPGEFAHPEVHTEVVAPTGDCSKHFFDAIYWVDPVNSSGSPWGWERGLPFVYSAQSEGKYLSSQIYSSNNGAGSCAGTKRRSTYLRFRHDATPGSGSSPQTAFMDTNRQVEATRLVYNDDGGRWVDSESSEFDGLGHFRRTVTTSNLWATANLERRESFTDFSRSVGTYPGTYTPLAPSEPWVLGIVDAIQTTEPDGTGETTSRVEFGVDRTTGFLNCTRVLASGASRQSQDLLTVQVPDLRGRVTDVKQYGGDLQGLPTTAGCGISLPQPAYWATNEYDSMSGALVRKRARTPSGGFAPFYSYDVDVDPWTGWVVEERDAAGFRVTHHYDNAGRILSSTPQSGARSVFTYTHRPAANETKVNTKSLSARGSVLAESEVIFDDLGRLWKQRRRLPGGVWSEQETLTNARGWVTSVSQRGDLTQTTQYLGFDPFGRPTTIRPPDGAAHDVLISYQGDRVRSERSKVAQAGGEAYATRTYVNDGHGRLRQVKENSGSNGAVTTTTSYYDVGSRLTRTSSLAQTRWFTFDNRGFLLSERHPEKGATGNGWVTYDGYDAAGFAHGMVDGPHSLAFTYDFMGRPLATRDRNRGMRLVTETGWDQGIGFGNGKLWFNQRHNYLELPWDAPGEDSVIIRQDYLYNGPGGAPTTKNTNVFWNGKSDDLRVTQRYAYDDLGNVTATRYPYCEVPLTCNSSNAGSGRLVRQTFDQGLLTGVTGWTNGITYHSSGLWKEIRHVNGVWDRQDRDDNFSTRPKRLRSIFSSGAPAGFDTGLMSYDGSGNLKAMDTHSFTYDSVSRLVDASYLSGAFNQGYSYDPYGNLTGVTGSTSGMGAPPVNSSTNRLLFGTYDAAGNLLRVPSLTMPWLSTYDTSNRVTSQAGMKYLYDANGERTVTIGHSIGPIPPEAATFHLRGLDQRLLAEIRMNRGVWSKNKDFIYAGDRLLGRATPTASDRHFHLDHLESVRLITAADGTSLEEHFFRPYGENASGPFAADPLLFTGHERDRATGGDYMHARHYQWQMGRFTSVDPVLGSPSAPQSLNRYAYVMGNPLNATDPTGMFQEEEHRPGAGEPNFTMPSFWGAIGLGGSAGGVIPQNLHVQRFLEVTSGFSVTVTLNGEPGGIYEFTQVAVGCLAGCTGFSGPIGGVARAYGQLGGRLGGHPNVDLNINTSSMGKWLSHFVGGTAGTALYLADQAEKLVASTSKAVEAEKVAKASTASRRAFGSAVSRYNLAAGHRAVVVGIGRTATYGSGIGTAVAIAGELVLWGVSSHLDSGIHSIVTSTPELDAQAARANALRAQGRARAAGGGGS
ncbi:MAG: RHS repeat-associated core domain-containing protein [Deltaproteobacteria bacterium]|nr:RHS repeat-associated core domain-containing protein [Deltaproteobacteria bacterium]